MRLLLSVPLELRKAHVLIFPPRLSCERRREKTRTPAPITAQRDLPASDISPPTCSLKIRLGPPRAVSHSAREGFSALLMAPFDALRLGLKLHVSNASTQYKAIGCMGTDCPSGGQGTSVTFQGPIAKLKGRTGCEGDETKTQVATVYECTKVP